MNTPGPRPLPQLDPNRVAQAANEQIQRGIELSKRPATDSQLAQIWPPWNFLPASLLPEEKHRILTCDKGNKHHLSPDDRLHWKASRRRFRRLPFDPDEYYQAFLVACRWSELTSFAETTLRLHKQLVEAQLDYSTFDNLLTGRVAIYRVVQELEFTRPGLLKVAAPTLADVQHLQQRYQAYLQARSDAIALLHPLVFLRSLSSARELPYKQRAFGLPHPPENFPRHLYIARLAALGKSSSKRLDEFMARDFLKLSRAEMDQFCDEYHRPSKARQGKYLFLAVWLADNAPLFNAFKLTWSDILNTAKERFNQHGPEGFQDTPDNPDSLKEFWKDHEQRFWRGQARRITPPNGRPNASINRAVPVGLLTPLPFLCSGEG